MAEAVQSAVRAPLEQPQSISAFPTGKFHVTHEKDAYWDHRAASVFCIPRPRHGRPDRRPGSRPRHPTGGCKPSDTHYHTLDFQMVYVLKGWARVWFDGIAEVRFEQGSCMYQEPGIVHKVLEYSDDYTVIEIAMPADFSTVTVAP